MIDVFCILISPVLIVLLLQVHPKPVDCCSLLKTFYFNMKHTYNMVLPLITMLYHDLLICEACIVKHSALHNFIAGSHPCKTLNPRTATWRSNVGVLVFTSMEPYRDREGTDKEK